MNKELLSKLNNEVKNKYESGIYGAHITSKEFPVIKIESLPVELDGDYVGGAFGFYKLKRIK